MTRWRWLVSFAVAAATLLLVFSALAFEARPPFSPGPHPQAGSPRWVERLEARSGPERLGAALAGAVSQYLVGLLVLFVVPRRVRHLAQAMASGGRRLARYLLLGGLLAALLAAVGLLSVLAVHTFPLPFLLGAAFFLAALLGAVALAYQLGRELLTRAGWATGSPLAHLALGTWLLFALSQVPYYGWLVVALVWLTGAGAAVATRFGSGRPWTLTPLLEE